MMMGNKQKFLKINNSEEYDLQNFGNKPQTSKRSRLLIGPARLPLLTEIVMSPAAAAAMRHFLAPHAGPVY